jgi:hypothetical protein
MIKGATYWNDKNRVYAQTNNPTEEILRKRIGEIPPDILALLRQANAAGYLESCGPTAAVTCLDCMGSPVAIRTPGGWDMQPEGVLADWFNDPRNYPAMRMVRGDAEADPERIPGNRVPQFYPVAVKHVFGSGCSFLWLDNPEQAIDHIVAGRAVQLCLKTPGHYIAAVAYDDVTREIIYNDPWPGRHEDGNGYNRRMTEAEWRVNLAPFSVVYYG